MSDIISLFASLRPRPRSPDWTQQELAEFYRVQAALDRSGIAVTTDRGLSDEGDPWFVFCRANSDDVLVHIGRIDGLYVVVSEALQQSVRGRNLRDVVKSILETPALALSAGGRSGPSLMVHPAALLTALVAVSFLTHTQSDASELDKARELEQRVLTGSHHRFDFAVLSAVAAAAVLVEQFTDHRISVDGADEQFLLASDDAPASPPSDGSAAPQITVDHSASRLSFHSLLDRPDLHGLNFQEPEQAPLNRAATELVATAEAIAVVKQTVRTSGPDLPLPHAAPLSPDESEADAGRQLQQPIAESSVVQHPNEMSSVRAGPERATGSGAVDPTQLQQRSQAVVEAARFVSGQGPSELVSSAPTSANVIDVAGQQLRDAGLSAPNVEHVANQLTDNLSGPHEPTRTGSILSFDDAGQAAILAFTRATPHLEVVISGRDVVMLDTDPSHAGQAFGVQTYEFADGSTVSLVGILPQVHALHA